MIKKVIFTDHSNDILVKYFHDINKYPILSNDEITQLIPSAQKGNEEAIDLLINRVASSCHNCNRAHKTMEDCAPCEEALSLAVKAIENIDRITAERDAAIDDLAIATYGSCHFCKHNNRGKCEAEKIDRYGGCWEWRGIQNEGEAKMDGEREEE